MAKQRLYDSDITLYYSKGRTLISVKESMPVTWEWVRKNYNQIREDYLEKNKDSRLFGKVVNYYLEEAEFKKITTELGTSTQQMTKFGFSSNQNMFTIQQETKEKEK